MDKTTQMTVFVRAVDAGSFSAAGRALQMTPSAVSKQVSRLEQRLQVRLVNRTTRRLSLTAEGQTFYERSVRILADIDGLERALTELHDKPRGTFRVTATTGFTKHQVVPLIPEFLERYPEVSVQLELNDRHVDLVAEGIDVAIRIGNLADSSLVARKLGVNRRVICAAPAYLKKHGAPRVPEDLRHHNCLTFSDSPRFNDWEFEESEGLRTLRVSGNLSVNHTDALYQSVLAGIGLARLATYLVGPDLRTGRLIPVLAEYSHEKTPIYAVYPHRRHVPAKVRVFLDYLLSKFTPTPPWEADLKF